MLLNVRYQMIYGEKRAEESITGLVFNGIGVENSRFFEPREDALKEFENDVIDIFEVFVKENRRRLLAFSKKKIRARIVLEFISDLSGEWVSYIYDYHIKRFARYIGRYDGVRRQELSDYDYDNQKFYEPDELVLLKFPINGEDVFIIQSNNRAALNSEDRLDKFSNTYLVVGADNKKNVQTIHYNDIKQSLGTKNDNKLYFI